MLFYIEDFMDEEDLNDYPEAGKTIVTRTDFDSITGARHRDKMSKGPDLSKFTFAIKH